MDTRIRDIVSEAAKDFTASWRTLAVTHLAYTALAFAILTPATALFLRWLLSRAGSRVLADADIARFFITTPAGITAILLGAAVVTAIAALESGCLMAIGLAAAHGSRIRTRHALLFAASRTGAILRVAGQMVLRVIAGLLPFVAALGLVYATLLRDHDINYYLSLRPPEFLIGATLAAVIVAALAALLVRTLLRWSLVLPLVLFEDVPPRRALRESAARTEGRRGLIALVLGGWALGALALAAVTTWLVEGSARLAAPFFAKSLPMLLLFLAVLLMVWAATSLAVAIVNASFFSLLIMRIWFHAGRTEAHLPSFETADPGRGVSRGIRVAAVATAVLLAIGAALVAFAVTRGNDPVLVIAHRGASEAAPENTLAAFRTAVDERADFVELDVQESRDGEVMVVHDSDLMKVGRSPMKIWEHDAAELRGVDVGSFRDAKFKGERVPTLAEALATCKGSRVLVELKSYGHNQRLEERVATIVEAARMQDHCMFMSMDHGMVRRLKQLRPSWRVGALLAKAVGDPTKIGADFLAVEARMADGRFVRRSHRAGQDVYVWTVNDPRQMLQLLTSGVDGLITNRPALAREVAQRRSKMSDAQRLLAALLLRSGARTPGLVAEEALRP